MNRAAEPPQAFVDAQRLRRQGRLEEAIAILDAMLREAPAFAPVLNLRGLARHDLGDFDGALADFDAALAATPGFAGAHYNRGVALLFRGDYGRGWPEYAWRSRVPGAPSYGEFAMPRWSGEDLRGRSLLVYAEQGQGDTIQFARFLAPLARTGATIDLYCHAPLVSLMSRIAGVRSAASRLAPGRTHDFHASIIDVGAAQLPAIEAAHWWGPYVTPLAERVARFAALLERAPRPLVGVAWKGSTLHPNDAHRSLGRDAAVKLLEPGATYVTLQLGEAPLAGSMIDAAAAITDWDDTAALVSLLDRVVTVDTAVAHLAGAMGRPVTTILPFAPDWRWGASAATTRWYPSMRLVRRLRA